MNAVVIDLDGTLLDTQHTYRHAFMTALIVLGFDLPASVYDAVSSACRAPNAESC